jgi:hypothetical protein
VKTFDAARRIEPTTRAVLENSLVGARLTAEGDGKWDNVRQ